MLPSTNFTRLGFQCLTQLSELSQAEVVSDRPSSLHLSDDRIIWEAIYQYSYIQLFKNLFYANTLA